MANILYGVNGEGSGHSSRAREVITHLQAQGHRVHVASFDRGYRKLRDHFEVTEIDGLRLAYVENRVRYRKTLVRNLLHLPQTTRMVRLLEGKAAGWELDVVITDYEPITCHVGHKLKLPVIAIDNQHFFTAPLRKRKATLFPPILREAVLKARPTNGDFVLVYVTAEAAQLIDLLKTVRQRFVCYGFNRTGKEENIEFRKPGLDTFLQDLSGCRAVIANAGFSLITEALCLGKPYLAWPVKKQFEQVFNAYYIGRMGYGAYWDDVNKERVEAFLFNIEEYREKLAGYPRADNSALFSKLDELIAGMV